MAVAGEGIREQSVLCRAVSAASTVSAVRTVHCPCAQAIPCLTTCIPWYTGIQHIAQNTHKNTHTQVHISTLYSRLLDTSLIYTLHTYSHTRTIR